MDTVHSSNESKKVLLTDRGSEFGEPDRKPYQFHPRESLSGKTPYAAAPETYGEDALKALQLRPIDPDEVNLMPKLIKYNR